MYTFDCTGGGSGGTASQLKRRKDKDTAGDTSASETDKGKKKKKKVVGKKKRRASSSDADSSSAASKYESDWISSSSESESSSSSDSDGVGEKRKKKSKSKANDSASNWHRLNIRWPIEFRPVELLNKKFVNSLSVEELTKLCAFYNETDKLKKKTNTETLSRDRKPRKKKFKKSYDDFQKKLHPARFLRCPISAPAKWWGHSVPKKHPEVFRAISLDFIGADRSISQRVIAEAHDRTSVLTLKHFSTSNVSVQNRPMKEMRKQDCDGATTITDFNWDIPDSIGKVQDAIFNYCALLHNLWPFDPTGIAMLRLLNKYKWMGHVENVKTKVEIISGFFNEALLSNAQRAVNDEVILSFQNQEDLLKEVMVRSGVRPEVPFLSQQKSFGSFGQSNLGQQRNFAQGGYSIPRNKRQGGQQGGQQGGHQGGSQGGHQGATGNGNQAPRPYANINGVSTCRFFNDRTGGRCNNAPAGRDKCKDRSGKEFLHLCNAMNNSGNFCLKPHRNRDHR